MLDHDIEFYNNAEPVTTSCPFLPGQPVNVLHVPIVLPDSQNVHCHENAHVSQTSDCRTMNPEDKYLNPRKPPRPQLPRLRTSPPLLQLPYPCRPAATASTSSANVARSSSQPTSAVDSVGDQNGRVVKAPNPARSLSPPRSRGFLAALRYFNASPCDANSSLVSRNESVSSRLDSQELGLKHWTSNAAVQPTVPANGMSQSADSTQPPLIRRAAAQGYGQLVLREPVVSTSRKSVVLPAPVPIQSRRLRSRSREPSPLRGFLTLESQSQSAAESTVEKEECSRHARGGQLETVQEAKSLCCSSVKRAVTGNLADLQDLSTPRPLNLHNKRLPTLPNTPSSVMDEELSAMDARNQSVDVDALCSHFSDLTTTTELSTSQSPSERSRFSEWSATTDGISPKSQISSLSPCFSSGTGTGITTKQDSEPDTPHLDAESNTRSSSFSVAGDSPFLLPSLPRLTISLSSSDLAFSGIEGVEALQAQPHEHLKRHAALFHDSLDGLGLCRSPELGTDTLPSDAKHAAHTLHRGDDDDSGGADSAPAGRAQNRLSCSTMEQSAAMQELMDELGYLKNIIEAGADDE